MASLVFLEGQTKGKVEGKIEGKIEGRAEGLREGQIEGQRKMMAELVRLKFPDADQTTMAAVYAMSDEQIAALFPQTLHAQSLEALKLPKSQSDAVSGIEPQR